MKNNLPFFAHDNDAQQHPKFCALRARYGWEGYGRFWALNELIAQAERCQLDIQRPLNRANIAAKMGFSDSEFTDFVAFLADPELCGLVHMLDGILITDRTQEDFERVDAKRKKDRDRIESRQRDSRGRTVGEKLIIAGENDNIAGDATTEQSRAEQIRAEKIRAEQSSNGAPAACPPFSPAQIQERLAFAALDVTLDAAAAGHVAQALQAAGCEDLDYLDWALERISVRANGKPIHNTAGYLLSVVGLPDWISAWRHERELRAAVRRPATPAPSSAPPEPDNPAAVEKMLGELPWKEGGKRKDAPALPAQGGTS